jgi:stress-induced morphogen
MVIEDGHRGRGKAGVFESSSKVIQCGCEAIQKQCRHGRSRGGAHCLSELISARVFDGRLKRGFVITPDVLTDYILMRMPDADVTVTDRTGTMDHLKVVIVSAAFHGKNLLDRHRMIYQALDAPMKDGRIHALELTARTRDEA